MDVNMSTIIEVN